MAHGTRPARLGAFFAMSVGCCLVGQAALASEEPLAPVARAMSNGHLDQKGSSASESAPLSGAGVEGRASATAGGTDDLAIEEGVYPDPEQLEVIESEDDDDDSMASFLLRNTPQKGGADSMSPELFERLEQLYEQHDRRRPRRLDHGDDDDRIDYCDEQSFYDNKNNVVFEDCVVLVDNFASSYGTCASYCQFQGLGCNASVSFTADLEPQCFASCDYDFDESYEVCEDDGDACTTYSSSSYEVACLCSPDYSVLNEDYCDEWNWRGVIDFVVCDDCTVLANTSYIDDGTCTGYCAANEMGCKNGYKDDGGTCDWDSTVTDSGCDVDFGASAICECDPDADAAYSFNYGDDNYFSSGSSGYYCGNTDHGATDADGYSCDDYYSNWCTDEDDIYGIYVQNDDDDFTATDMCCNCGGGDWSTGDGDYDDGYYYGDDDGEWAYCPMPAPAPTTETSAPTTLHRPSPDPTMQPTRMPRVQVRCGGGPSVRARPVPDPLPLARRARSNASCSHGPTRARRSKWA